jgi:hypothetical protein
LGGGGLFASALQSSGGSVDRHACMQVASRLIVFSLKKCLGELVFTVDHGEYGERKELNKQQSEFSFQVEI